MALFTVFKLYLSLETNKNKRLGIQSVNTALCCFLSVAGDRALTVCAPRTAFLTQHSATGAWHVLKPEADLAHDI